jgi:hypothetical protein
VISSLKFADSLQGKLGELRADWVLRVIWAVLCGFSRNEKPDSATHNASEGMKRSGVLPVLRGFSRNVKPDSEASRASGGLTRSGMLASSRTFMYAPGSLNHPQNPIGVLARPACFASCWRTYARKSQIFDLQITTTEAIAVSG